MSRFSYFYRIRIVSYRIVFVSYRTRIVSYPYRFTVAYWCVYGISKVCLRYGMYSALPLTLALDGTVRY